ncbi:hypothetical protein BXZ70DRAFT_416629 [Cristinia sonorae]|uniref:Uncharacterized protein n=1 Tax=Cristinia sonorae TaxID=1940300 RepID=A0A8K0UX78_9AGAR|nr:hypothetical protein BXZ70DRAFT_416629 [Cristinia sonorae]
MCHAYGSLEQATAGCPMCKVFRPSAPRYCFSSPRHPCIQQRSSLSSRCPHIKEVCRNRALHPRIDVVYLKNAEVQTFMGCGYCKYARTNSKLNLISNPGWPGCCRPPASNEQRLIGAADWPAVSMVHHIPIPPDVKAVLDSITGNATPNRPSPTGSMRGFPQPHTPSMVRRGSYHLANAVKSEGAAARTAPVAIPAKGRSGGSPQQLASSLTSMSNNPNGDTSSSSLPNSSAMDQYVLQRRPVDKSSGESKQQSPKRDHAELTGSISRKGHGAATNNRPSISAAIPSMSLSKVTVDAQPQRRRVGASTTTTPVSTLSRASEKPTATPSRKSLEGAMAGMNISSASSDSSGSASETTVISDGGFTDYLSDESEAELQRQAEIKAAQIAQNQMEEQEFKAARQQLAHIDLRPPKSWTAGK